MKYTITNRWTGEVVGYFWCRKGEHLEAFIEFCNEFQLRCVEHRFYGEQTPESA